MRDLIEQKGGLLRLNLHRGQRRAWESNRNVIAVIAGTGGGKTSFGPLWLYREIQQCGPGDYIVATPTFPLLDAKALPTLISYFSTRLDVGKYFGTPSRRFLFSESGARRTFGKRYDPYTPTRIMFGYAADPDSLEAATAKAAWLDEAGQKKFRVGSYYALRRRLGQNRGRMLITTTVYYSGWLKSLIYDRWHAGDKDIDVVQFPSTSNPQYSQEEFGRAQRELPRWLFNMQYRGVFESPPGRIYDCIDTGKNSIHRVPRFPIPPLWRRFAGVDFGEVNVCVSFWAEEPETRHLYLYAIYYPETRRSTAAHVRELRKLSPGRPVAFGGAGSEDDWRADFAQNRFPVRKPSASDVSLQINASYAVWATGGASAFDDLDDFWEEVCAYSYKQDDIGNITAEIEDDQSYHVLASMRYLLSEIRAGIRPPADPDAKLVVPAATDPLNDYDASDF